MQGQTGIAKKVYECVPISEPWRSFSAHRARNMTVEARRTFGLSRAVARSGRFRTDPPHWY